MWVMRLLLPEGVVWIRALPVVFSRRQDAMQHQSFKTDPGLKLPPLRIDYTLSAHSAAGRAPVSSLDVLR